MKDHQLKFIDKHFLILFVIIFLSACKNVSIESPAEPYIKVLGIAQDAGFPQAQCNKKCCKDLWDNLSLREKVSSIALVDPTSNASWIFDATPDFKDQLHLLEKFSKTQLKGIFLTHAHIGHYTGLMQLGREAMGAKQMPVYCKERMKNYLTNNGPWSQLVTLKNIHLRSLDSTVQLSKDLKVKAFEVPHRDEYSETVGFEIYIRDKRIIFIPDIDKWNLWESSIIDLIKDSDRLYLDGTFFANGEIPNRDMSQIPHPFIEESISHFSKLSSEDKDKIHFIHFNHTNPVLNTHSTESQKVLNHGFHLAREGDIYLPFKP